MNDDDELPLHVIAGLPRPVACDVVHPDFGFLASVAKRRAADRLCRDCDKPLPAGALRYCSLKCWRRRPPS